MSWWMQVYTRSVCWQFKTGTFVVLVSMVSFSLAIQLFATQKARAQGSQRVTVSPAFNGFYSELDRETEEEPEDALLGDPEFTLVRGKYTNYVKGGRARRGPGSGWWETDFDDSDRNFLRGIQRYTSLDAKSSGYIALDLTDPSLFEHTFVYINMKRVPISSEGTGPNFSLEEATSLREFMLRGGFVLLDDFWGDQHWQDFLVEYMKIFPDRELVKLDTSHPIFHSFFDVNEIAQVPGRSVTWNYGGRFILDDPQFPPSVHAVLDDDGRVMMVANFNTDLGDGWEHTFYEPYPTRYCNEAYKIGINYVVYALSH